MNDHPVRPDVRVFLDRMAAQPMPPFTAEFLKIVRTMPIDPAMLPDLPEGELAVIRDMAVPGPAGDLSARFYDPREERGPGPVVLFFHGGGFVVGGHATHGGLAAEIARALDLPVVSIEYRLAPEHPWPAAPDDAEAATRWVAGNGAVFGREFTHLVLCGDSAGGNLASVVALALRDRAAALPVLLQVPIYPKAHQGGRYESHRAFGQGYGLDASNMKLYDQHYRAEQEDWRASPLLADQTGVAPTFVVTAALDPLRDEGRAYAAKTALAGVRTAYKEIAGTIHGFATYRRVIPSAVADLAGVLAVMKAMVAEGLVEEAAARRKLDE